MKRVVKPRKRCRPGSKFAGNCCVQKDAVVALELRNQVSDAMSQMAERLRYRKRMIVEAVQARKEVEKEMLRMEAGR
jgi:hypothetical protein